jgi:hypothetical protein
MFVMLEIPAFLAFSIRKNNYRQCTGGGLRKGGYVQPDHGSVPPLPWFLLAERFDQRGRSSPAPLALGARWDSNHGVSMEPFPALSAYRCTSAPYQLRWPG